MTLPPKISKGDVLYFNVTNTATTSKYNGTMLTYTFPFDCEVMLDVAGARGGKGNGCNNDQVGKGAFLRGVFNFSKGDTLLMCIGQAGTDHGGSTSDGTSGAGGGGTFIVKKSTDGTGDIYTGAGVGNGWKVKPLVVSAGGNGSQDVGYSGVGTIYHGLATTEADRTLKANSGASYSSRYSTDANSGTNFLAGAQGATANYSRSGTSYAGFGGGGGNSDDGAGGGGSGWFGGLRGAMSACSYISPEATSVERLSGNNSGEGYFKIMFRKISSVNARCKVNGEIKNVSSMKIRVNGVWKEVSGVKSKINGTWK